MGIIKTNSHANQIAISNDRAGQLIALPPFSYPGTLVSGKESGRLFPNRGMAIKYITIATRTIGLNPTYLVFKTKDPITPTGEIIFQTVAFPANSKYLLVPLTGDMMLDSTKWISVLIFLAGGHSDLVVTFHGVPSGNGFVDL